MTLPPTTSAGECDHAGSEVCRLAGEHRPEAAKALVDLIEFYGGDRIAAAAALKTVKWTCPRCGHNDDHAYQDCGSCESCIEAQGKLALRSGHMEACDWTLKANNDEINAHLHQLAAVDREVRAAERAKCGKGYWSARETDLVLSFMTDVTVRFEFDEGRPVLRQFTVNGAPTLSRKEVTVLENKVDDDHDYWQDYAIDRLIDGEWNDAKWEIVGDIGFDDPRAQR